MQRSSARLFAIGLLAGLGAAAAQAAEPAPIVGTDRLAQPAEPAPFDESSKRFIKATPSTAPRLSTPPPAWGPILPALKLNGHRDDPPSTTKPLKPEHAHGSPPPGDD